MLTIGITHFNRSSDLINLFSLWNDHSSHSFVSLFEFLVVDDCSKPAELEQVSKALETRFKHFNAHLILHRSNKGVGCSKNSIFLNASFDKVFVLDSDNFISLIDVFCLFNYSNSIESSLISPEITYYYYNRVGTRGLPELNTATDNSSLEKYFFGDPVYNNGNLLIDKSIWERVGGYPRHVSLDTQYFAAALRSIGIKYHVCHDTSYWHRRHKRKKNSSYWRSFESELFSCEQFAIVFPLLMTNYGSQYMPLMLEAFFLRTLTLCEYHSSPVA